MPFEERKFAKETIVEHPEPRFGLGAVTAKFTAERYPGTPLLDTSVEIEVAPFSITWKDKEKFTKELAELIGRYLI